MLQGTIRLVVAGKASGLKSLPQKPSIDSCRSGFSRDAFPMDSARSDFDHDKRDRQNPHPSCWIGISPSST